MPEITLDRRRTLVGAVVVLILLALAGRTLLRSSTPTVPPPVRLGTSSRHAPASRLAIDVVGAVRRPGLYRLPSGSRVADAVARAGGATPRAQLELVNLAAPVADGEQILVPRRGNAGPAVGTGTAPQSGPVHLNTATLEKLDSLPGVGPVTAQKILDYRREHGAFGSVDELDAISGIGPARLGQLRDLVAP